MNHRAICYDDEGRLDCSLRCRIGEAEREAEQISRAEAERLIELHFLESMGMVLKASLPKPETPPDKR